MVVVLTPERATNGRTDGWQRSAWDQGRSSPSCHLPLRGGPALGVVLPAVPAEFSPPNYIKTFCSFPDAGSTSASQRSRKFEGLRHSDVASSGKKQATRTAHALDQQFPGKEFPGKGKPLLRHCGMTKTIQSPKTKRPLKYAASAAGSDPRTMLFHGSVHQVKEMEWPGLELADAPGRGGEFDSTVTREQL